MGMDVYGKKEGAYFRASVWSWRPICAVMKLAGVEVPDVWHFNDGAGVETQEEATAIAEKIEKYMATMDDSDLSLPAPKGMGVNADGRFGVGGTISPYSTDRSRLEEFCKFLRNCGGFRIC